MAGNVGEEIDLFLSDLFGLDKFDENGNPNTIFGSLNDNRGNYQNGNYVANSVNNTVKDVINWIGENVVPYLTGEAQYNWNKSLQDDAQLFNSSEAKLSRDWQSSENAVLRAFNSVEAQKQRDYDFYMSSTELQRRKEDAQKAGLNPFLLYASGGTPTSHGAAASSGSAGGAATASSGANSVGMVHNIYQDTLNTVISSVLNNSGALARQQDKARADYDRLDLDRDERQMILRVLEFMKKFGKMRR